MLEGAAVVLAGAHRGDEVEPEPRYVQIERFGNIDNRLETCLETAVAHIHRD